MIVQKCYLNRHIFLAFLGLFLQELEAAQRIFYAIGKHEKKGNILFTLQ